MNCGFLVKFQYNSGIRMLKIVKNFIDEMIYVLHSRYNSDIMLVIFFFLLS